MAATPPSPPLPDLGELLAGGGDAGPFAMHLGGGPGFSLAWGPRDASTSATRATSATGATGATGATSAPIMSRLRVAADTGWGALHGVLRGESGRSLTLVEPSSGLTAEVTYLRHRIRGLANATALSWRGWIENRGDRPVEHLTRIAMLEVAISLSEGAAGNPTVRSMRGGMNDAFFPPEAFAVTDRTLYDSYRVASVELDSGGTGRSTDRDVPYVVVASGDDSGGCFAALGWSALWTLRVARTGASLRLDGVIEGLDLSLAPGERIPLPETLLGFYAGDLQHGANALRRILTQDFVPLLGGAPVQPPVAYDHWFEFRLNVHEDLLRPQLAPCAALGVEYFVVDAGWFGDSETSYRRGCGSWGREATQRFPSGVRAFGDTVRAHGMRFGLWMDPELIHPESDTGRAHPEWLLAAPGSSDGAAVADFSQQVVRDWAVDTICDVVGRYDLGWLRWDVNMPLAPNWAANDPPGKTGWHQVQHVAGVHEIHDRVLARYPELLLEGCCGGGRRMDLGLLRRTHTFWCSDMTGPAPIVRAHQSGGNRLLPAGRFNTNFLYGPADPHEPAGQSPARWLSHFGGPLGISGDFRSWTAAQLDAGRRYVDAFKRWRHVLAGDFYPLFALPRSLADWDGWQFDDPERREGIVIAFREASPMAQTRLPLHGTATSAPVELTALDDAVASASFACGDAPLELPAHGAGAWTYRVASQASSGQ